MDLRARLATVVVLGTALVACGSTDSVTTIPVGTWGSLATEMDVSASGATITFCCAGGQIPPPLTVDASGHFELSGTYSPHRGPVPAGGFPPLPATYAGSINGSRMTLVVTTSANPAPETYTLSFGTHITALCVCPLLPPQAAGSVSTLLDPSGAQGTP